MKVWQANKGNLLGTTELTLSAYFLKYAVVVELVDTIPVKATGLKGVNVTLCSFDPSLPHTQ